MIEVISITEPIDGTTIGYCTVTNVQGVEEDSRRGPSARTIAGAILGARAICDALREERSAGVDCMVAYRMKGVRTLMDADMDRARAERVASALLVGN
jgi:hypothetical protein